MQIQFYRFQALHEPSNCVVVSPCRVPVMHEIEQRSNEVKITERAVRLELSL